MIILTEKYFLLFQDQKNTTVANDSDEFINFLVNTLNQSQDSNDDKLSSVAGEISEDMLSDDQFEYEDYVWSSDEEFDGNFSSDSMEETNFLLDLNYKS